MKLSSILITCLSTTLFAAEPAGQTELHRANGNPDAVRVEPSVMNLSEVLTEEQLQAFRELRSLLALRQQFDTTQPGWRALGADDFTKVNSADDTWTWRDDGTLACSGKPVSVLRTKEPLTNFELVVEWMHEKPAGNSGVFVWTTPESIEKLTAAGKPGLPDGIEVQVLDNAFADKVAEGGGKTDWFTTHGDVFSVRVKMTPIGKTSPNGSRSFPREEHSKGHGHWNHYYIRAINGEVRLWVNGKEVSGGTGIEPATGYLCLESEGSPILFRNLHLRELP